MTGGKPRGRHGFEPLSYAVLGACIDVQRQLGVHCREVDYHRALEAALAERGLHCQREVEVPVAYGDRLVAALRVDFRVLDDSDELLLEVKARPRLLREDGEQCLRYLQQGRYRICLLVNFGQKPFGRRRFVYSPPEDASR
ncbi:MAG: GxxExxY protein [Anaerolineae bacterium]|nr:GxxExxY protein [Anaerolineae bacterium]